MITEGDGFQGLRKTHLAEVASLVRNVVRGRKAKKPTVFFVVLRWFVCLVVKWFSLVLIGPTRTFVKRKSLSVTQFRVAYAVCVGRCCAMILMDKTPSNCRPLKMSSTLDQSRLQKMVVPGGTNQFKGYGCLWLGIQQNRLSVLADLSRSSRFLWQQQRPKACGWTRESP